MDEYENDELVHYGVKGMKWGIRKSDNASQYNVDVKTRKNLERRVGYARDAKVKADRVADKHSRKKVSNSSQAKSESDFWNKQYKKEEQALKKHVDKMVSDYGSKTVKSISYDKIKVGKARSDMLVDVYRYQTAKNITVGYALGGIPGAVVLNNIESKKRKQYYDEMRHSDELYHWVFNKNHKYIAKIKISPKYTRYFYSKEEYLKYLNAAKNSIKDKLTSKVSSISKFGTKKGTNVDTVYITNTKSTKAQGEAFVKKLKTVAAVVAGPTVTLGAKFVAKVTSKITSKVNSTSETVSKTVAEKTHKYIAKVELSNGEYRYFYDQDEYDAYLKRQEYQENEPNFMKNISEIEDPMTADEDMCAINTGYEKSKANGDTERTDNCVMCSIAYELRRRGYDVDSDIAVYDNPLGSTSNALKFFNQAFSGDVYKNAVTTECKVSELVTELSGQTGTRGELSLSWRGLNSGHSVVYEVSSSGDVVIRDCQTTTVYTTDGTYETTNSDIKVEKISDLINTSRVSAVEYTRTDNLELGKGAVAYVIDNNK